MSHAIDWPALEYKIENGLTLDLLTAAALYRLAKEVPHYVAQMARLRAEIAALESKLHDAMQKPAAAAADTFETYDELPPTLQPTAKPRKARAKNK